MEGSIKAELIDGKARIGVWGCGYIGFTSIVNFAKEGIYSIGYDVNEKVIKAIQSGESHIPNLDFWIGYHINLLVEKMVKATSNWADMMEKDVRVHLIAVPTEKDGEPWPDPLKDVMLKLRERMPSPETPDLVIIESTLTPGAFKNIVIGMLGESRVGREFLVGIAPRRDWFDSPEKNLKTLKRVVGGTTPETSQVMKDVLGIVCDNLIVSDAHTVELVKSVENSIFHVCAVYACQLARAYPDVDIAEVLRLASTHWRIPLYFPSVGTGGYCIPVSSKYVRDGATEPDELWLTEAAINYDSQQPYFIADMMTKRTKGDIGILGLSYKRDLKVHVLSPALKIVERLKDNGVSVKVFDPYYSADEIARIVDAETFEYPDELKCFDGLIIVTPHRLFGQTPKNILFKCLRKGQKILDNEGIWKKRKDDFSLLGIDYHCVGDKGWCL